MTQAALATKPIIENSNDDVIEWSLATARSLWRQRAHDEALEWLRRGANAARASGAGDRAAEIDQAASFLRESLENLAEDDGSGRGMNIPEPPRSSTRAVHRSAPTPRNRLQSEVCPSATAAVTLPPAPLRLLSPRNAATAVRTPANSRPAEAPRFVPSFAEEIMPDLLTELEPEDDEEDYETLAFGAQHFADIVWDDPTMDKPHASVAHREPLPARGCFEEAPTLTRDGGHDAGRSNEDSDAPPPAPIQVALVPTSARGDFRLLALDAGQPPPEGAVVATVLPSNARDSWVLTQLVAHRD